MRAWISNSNRYEQALPIWPGYPVSLVAAIKILGLLLVLIGFSTSLIRTSN